MGLHDFGNTQDMSADPVQTNPDHYSVLLENDRVRVLQYRDQPGDATHPHEHPDSVMISLSGFDRRLRNGDAEVEVSIPAGEVRWLAAQEHSGQNIGATETMTIFVELKEGHEHEHAVVPGLGPSEDPNASANRPSPDLLNSSLETEKDDLASNLEQEHDEREHS